MKTLKNREYKMSFKEEWRDVSEHTVEFTFSCYVYIENPLKEQELIAVTRLLHVKGVSMNDMPFLVRQIEKSCKEQVMSKVNAYLSYRL